MATRKNQEFHDNTCKLVAANRFSFPNNDHPDWQTFVNHPVQQISFENGKLAPDVVVLDNNKYARLIGEIETDDTVNSESVEQWKDYRTICKFLFVYVPIGYGAIAKKIGQEFVMGFREYSYNNGIIKINNV